VRPATDTMRYVALRVIAGIGVMWGAATLAFVLLHVVQGDPVAAVTGSGTTLQPAVRAQIVHDYGFDRPLLMQYFDWLGQLLQGNLGRSYQLDEPVSQALRGQIGPTVALDVAAVLLAVVASLALAILTAGRSRAVRSAASGFELVAASTPAFWLGLLALSYLSFRWKIFPGAGATGLSGLILPAAVLAVPLTGMLSQVLRQGLDEALAQPFAVTARARGLGPAALVTRHALRHALVSATTLVGWMVGALFGGAVLIETVFARPGVGRVLLAAVTSRDVPVVAAVVLLVAAAFTVVSLLVDLLVLAIDPRQGTPARS
jgi:peptide/nickel transport system permease protein